ncbi:response regulator [Desulfosporosinus lacus]|uniref:Stage 0 sporulation protein A homolog n=1 Tax=Desulfosporosinus lacus DSM 15449 TaxID=1121420 RepID=A0A1M6GT01_9FIRM|nr:response regulator transcription factor [Desulfosporosinus lacus]SHJ13088.1 two component transcriptional regulator, LuxR family [Desulfosporosinus lacus DSM 15449]
MVSNSKKTIKVVVVDDHTLFAEGTVSLLSSESSISVVGTAKNGSNCLEVIKTEHPDVVLLDINLPDYCGTDLIEKIKDLDSNIGIIMLTGENPGGYINASLKNGAQGFLLKDCSKAEMITAVLQVSRDEFYFSQNMAPYLGSAIIGEENRTNKIIKPDKTSCTSLTPKEIEIIELIAQGMRNREIATTLGIKNRTVDCHVSNILSKLDVKTRLEAVLTYMEEKE